MTTPDSSVPDGEASEASPLALTDRQQTLLRHLTALDANRKENSPELVPIYLGALEALHTRNADRFALAAHNLRELIRFMPRALLDEVRALEERMGDQVNGLTDSWQAALKNSKSRDGDGRWSGEIDPTLKRFLRKAGGFFDWVLTNREARRREIVDALHRLEASGRRLPPPLATANARNWQELADYFVAVCHHQRTTSDQEFSEKLDELETFFVQRMQPMTFERTRELKALLEGRDAGA